MEQVKPMLAGKVAIVTGASRGLGQYTALAFAKQGAKVVVVGRQTTENALHMPGNVYMTSGDIEEHTGTPGLPIVCDVRDAETVEAMVAKVLLQWGRIDILVNNAAYVMPEGETAAEIPPRLFEQMLQVNILGAFNAIRAVLPAMRAQRCGNIINVSGRSRTRGSPLEATKIALESLTVGLADELRPFGVAVNSLRPVGFIYTPGVLLNREVRESEVTPPNSYLHAAILLAMQTAETYTGQVKTDAEVIRDLAEEAVLQRYRDLNPPAWGRALSLA